MKYSVGQKVKIRSLEWYRDNVNRYGIIECGKYEFFEPMNEYCGKVVTIKRIDDDNYRIDADKGAFCWTDEMIEGLVEEENNDCEKCGLIRNSTKCLFMDNCPHTKPKNIIEIPEDYVIKDDNGNVINATKIVLEKKKPKYPKTYCECKDILGLWDIDDTERGYYKTELIDKLQMLLICRDAYWKIAGDEMGLGKPWSPSDSDYITGRYCIFVQRGNIICDTPAQDCILTFPTEEMRDAFYENFKELIESCKELL